jgi:hypothetical protein
MGKAAVLGAKAQPKAEVAVYRQLLAEDTARTEVRAYLVAALVELADWPSARVEIEAMLSRTPEDAQLRFLHGVALLKTGEAPLAEEERQEARRLGLPHEREVALCERLGLPPPPAQAPTPALSTRAILLPTPVPEIPPAEETRPRAPRRGGSTAGRRASTRKRK